jgi:hypothetical protein
METQTTQDFPIFINRAPSNDNRRHVPLSRPAFPPEAVAHIYRPCRSAMTSGPAPSSWRLEFEPRSAPFQDPLMGWTGSRDPLQQVALTFPTLDAALFYAERQGLRVMVHHDEQSRADERDIAKRAFSDDTLQRLGLGALQQRYGEAMAEARVDGDEPERQAGETPIDVLRRPGLSPDDKRSILMNWAFDEHLREQWEPRYRAAPRLAEIDRALLALERGAADQAPIQGPPRRAAATASDECTSATIA